MGKIYEGKTERIIQTQRTARGVCARCGEDAAAHVGEGRVCVDGKSSYTWAHTREGMQQLITNLEAIVGRKS